MITASRLAHLAKKWQRMAAHGRKRVAEGPHGTSMTVAGKGHCAMYTVDGRRFEVPLAYLSTAVFGELLRMSQEEFGFTGGDSGRITLPCDTTVMGYVMCLVRRNAPEEIERAFLSSIEKPCHLASCVAPTSITWTPSYCL